MSCATKLKSTEEPDQTTKVPTAEGKRLVPDLESLLYDDRPQSATVPLSPLKYMLEVMRDPTACPERRDRMAIGAAPYIHEKGKGLMETLPMAWCDFIDALNPQELDEFENVVRKIIRFKMERQQCGK